MMLFDSQIEMCRLPRWFITRWLSVREGKLCPEGNVQCRMSKVLASCTIWPDICECLRNSVVMTARVRMEEPGYKGFRTC
jgi:hypothetical protein